MTKPLPLLSDDQVRRSQAADEDAGCGALATPRGSLPLKAMDVHGRLDGLLSQVTLAQTFVNNFDEPLEATYIFPLPDRAAVTHFRMEVNGRVIEGVLKERGSARREYTTAIQTGQRAAIAEEERPGVFTMRVGNLLPGEEATVRLVLIGPLVYSDGEATFRFPLVVAPRYIPGRPLAGPSVGSGIAPDTDAVPDASRITPPLLLPGYPNPVALTLTVDLHSGGLPLDDVRSSLHAIAVVDGPGKQRITLQAGERLNRDFILRFRLGANAICTSLLLQPDSDVASKEGTFLLTVVPPVSTVQTQQPRDVVFVLDRSGSMAGWKMVAARRALARMVDTLGARDRFTVYAFDDAIETPAFGGASLAAATDRNRFRAVEFLAKIDSRGGTEMAQPLDRAVQQLAQSEAGRERILVLVTDGQVGNEDQILRTLGQRVQGIRIFTLGIDQAVNEAFLRRLALLGGGACDVVESEDRLDAVMDKVHRRIADPVCTALQLKAVGLQLDADALVPSRLPDLFAGAPLVVHGRYRGGAEGFIALEGRDAAGRPWHTKAVGHVSSNGAVAGLWARGHIRELEDEFVIGRGDCAALEKRIVATSLRFSVLCRFTAFVAVDRTAVVNAGGQVHRVTQAVEAPAGWGAILRKYMDCAIAIDHSCAYEMEEIGPAAAADSKAKASEAANSGMPAPGAKKMMLAKQVLQEAKADGRVSKKTQLAVDDAAREAVELSHDEASITEAELAPPPALNAQGAGSVSSAAPAGPPPAPAAASPPASNRRLRQSGGAPLASASRSGPLLSSGHGGPEQAKCSDGLAKEPFDLSAYRQRACDLLEQLSRHEAEAWTTRLTWLGIVAERLAALIEDLYSVTASAAEVEPLEKLVGDLRALLAHEGPAEAEMARLWARTVDVLRCFADGTLQSRDGFWK